MPMMQVVMLTRKGGPEVLEVVELPLPEPGQGEVRVRVRATGGGAGDPPCGGPRHQDGKRRSPGRRHLRVGHPWR